MIENNVVPTKRPIRIMPPVYLLLAAIAMGVLHYFWPGLILLEHPWRWLGAVPIVAGLVLGISAVRLFKKHQTTIVPGQVSSRLLIAGPYHFTRNPIYVGMTLILIGIAIMLGSLTPWIVLPVFIGVIAVNVIPVEEAMLREAFGDEYRQYSARVRRWI